MQDKGLPESVPYTYGYTSLDIQGDTATITYDSQDIGDKTVIVHDIARYLGALYRVDNGVTVASIDYSGQTFEWSGDLKGSNWKNSTVSLVGLLTNYFGNSQIIDNKITLTLKDSENNSVDLTLKYVINYLS